MTENVDPQRDALLSILRDVGREFQPPVVGWEDVYPPAEGVDVNLSWPDRGVQLIVTYWSNYEEVRIVLDGYVFDAVPFRDLGKFLKSVMRGSTERRGWLFKRLLVRSDGEVWEGGSSAI